MQLLKVSSGANFVVSGRKAPHLPIFISGDGVPHRALNAYLRHRLVDEKKDIKTVRDKDALHVSTFLNFLYQQVPKDDPVPLESWRRVTHGKMILFQRFLLQKELIPEVRNQYIQSIYSFYWFCEQRCFCKGVIGISDSATNGYEYPLYVFVTPVRSSRPFKIPLLERVSKRTRLNIGTPEQWDTALAAAYGGATAIHVRDELMLRMVRESNVRREELAHLHVSQFSEEAKYEFVTFFLRKDKNSKRRYIKVNVELYRDIQNYIECTRPEFLGCALDHGYLFTGLNREGMHFSLGYINQIFAKYGVKPHDGRSVSLTERFVELISSGVDKMTAMMLVSQEAGHSMASKGKTLELHYIQAQAISKAAIYRPLGEMRAKLLKKDAEIAELRKLLADKDR